MNMNYALTAALISCLVSCSAKIDISTLGLAPDGDQNAVPYLQRALEIASKEKNPTIVFPKGTYHFIPAFKGISDSVYCPNIIRDIDNLTIDGGDSEFVFHGKTKCFDFAGCNNLLVKNFVIDFERPMITQAEFVVVSDTSLRLKIDKSQYPYHIENGVVWYDGEGWSSRYCKYNNIFDKDSHDIIPGTHDDSAGNFWQGTAEEAEPGIIEFAGPFKWVRRPQAGDIVTMYNYIYPADAFHIENCTNVCIQDIVLHHGGSMAVYASAVDGITIDNFDIIERASKNRYFANMADGFHIKGCKGKVTVKNCDFNGGGDDFVNVHNMYASVREQTGENSLRVRSYKHFPFEKGDSVWFVSRASGQRLASNVIESITYESGEIFPGALFSVTFRKPVRPGIKADDVMESAVWCPEVEICHNRVYKRHRASGIRVTTPRKADIHHNWFNTAGHAILIEGDIVFWLESGANNALTIHDNIFDNCLTSGSTSGGRWEWGEAVIDITPSVKAVTKDSPAYHHNIIIRNNEFRVFDFPLLRARSVDNLQFTGNTVKLSGKYEPYTVLKFNFLLEGCRNVLIENNVFPQQMPGHNVATYMMKDSDLCIGADQDLSIREDAEEVVKLFEW